MSDLQEIADRHKEDESYGNQLSEYQTHLDRGWLLKRIAELEARWNDILAVHERFGELSRAAWCKEKTDE